MTMRRDELNALEEAEAEQRAGCSILAIDRDEPVARLFAALAWVHKRRTEPKLTFEDHLKAGRTKDNIAYLFGSDDEEADEPDDEPDDAVSDGPHPDAVDRALDDEGVPTDPFPEAAAPSGADGATESVADAEGQVLSLDRDSA